jgi:hypothetical protein
MKSKLIYFGILIFLLSVSIVLADDTEFAGEGETVWPIESGDIEMVAETVLVQPAEIGWDANCIFILKNTGESTEVQVGFPDVTDEGPGADLTEGTIKYFRCFVDSKEVQVEHKIGIQDSLNPTLKYPFAYVWKMTFNRGQVRAIRNTYNFRGVYRSDGTIELNYVLVTGALWKEKIGTADIIFDLGKINPHFAYSIKPAGYVIKNNQISWSFKDYEPEEDIEIGLSPLVQEWFEQADHYAKTDSVEVLKGMLDGADWLLERHIPETVKEEFLLKYDQLMRKFEKYGNSSRYRALKALRTDQAEEATKQSYKFLEELKNKSTLSEYDKEFVDFFVDIVERTLENNELCISFYEILLANIERDISSLDTIQDLASREKEKNFLLWKQKGYIEEIKNLNQLIDESKKRKQ